MVAQGLASSVPPHLKKDGLTVFTLDQIREDAQVLYRGEAHRVIVFDVLRDRRAAAIIIKELGPLTADEYIKLPACPEFTVPLSELTWL
jgi:hypothetical protein